MRVCAGLKVYAGYILEILSTTDQKNCLKLVFIAFLIAAPLSWWFMHRWLDNFAYRIAMPWWVFALAGLATVALASLTVGMQSLKTALANPAQSLKNE